MPRKTGYEYKRALQKREYNKAKSSKSASAAIGLVIAGVVIYLFQEYWYIALILVLLFIFSVLRKK